METEIALIVVLVLTTMYMVIAEARRIHNRFYLADEHVTFEELRDIFPATRGEGAATPGAELSAATAAGKVAATYCRTPSPAQCGNQVVQHADRKARRGN